MKAVILAGGGGVRLWPLSKDSLPKQFLRLYDKSSLLQKTVLRLLKIDLIDTIVISTNQAHFSLVEQQLKELKCEKEILITQEPCKRNTGPSIALTLRFLQDKHGIEENEPILVLPSDQIIEEEGVFHEMIREMDQMAKRSHLITFGIKPTKPETGYGYILAGKPLSSSTFMVNAFIEKPSLKRAKMFFQDPAYYWNAGIFLFTASLFWKETKKHSQELYKLASLSYEQALQSYTSMPSISIDYALMEKSKRILVCPLSISWSDVGSFDNLYEILQKDEKQNVKLGNVIDVDTERSLIISGKRLITTIGLKDMLIVETEDAIFIGKKGESQRIKHLVENLVNT